MNLNETLDYIHSVFRKGAGFYKGSKFLTSPDGIFCDAILFTGVGMYSGNNRGFINKGRTGRRRLILRYRMGKKGKIYSKK